MKKKLMIFAILLCLFLAVSTVNASNIEEGDLADMAVSDSDSLNLQEETVTAEAVNEASVADDSINEDVVGETTDSETNVNALMANDDGDKIGDNEPETVNVNNYGELYDLFGDGQVGRTSESLTVNLQGDEEYIITNKIVLNPESGDNLRTLTINGNNRVINGNEEYGFISAVTRNPGLNLIINNLTIKNCCPDKGGAINLPSSDYVKSNLTINNVLFENNGPGWYDGGAISFLGCSLTITDSNFTSNFASDNGGAIYADFDNGFFNIDNCIFTNNYGDYDGDECGDGGAIFIEKGPGTISNSKFIGNNAVSGGAIYSISNVKIINSNFTSNVATKYGAEIYSDENTLLDIVNCNVADDNIYTKEGSVVSNFKVTLPDEFAKGSEIDIIVTESKGFSGTVNVILGTEEVPISNFQNGGGSATVTPTLDAGTYNATLSFKADGAATETNITFKEIKVLKAYKIEYSILNNVTGNVAIEIRVYDGEEEVTGTGLVTLDGSVSGTVKPFRVYKNTELAAGNYSINATYDGVTKEINFTVVEDPFAALNEAQEELNTANNKITELNNTLNQTKEDLNTATEKVDNLTAKVNELNATLNETEKALNTANEKAGNLTAQINQLNSNINALNNAINQAQSSLNSAAAQINNLNAQVKELKANNTSLQKSLNTVKAQNTKLNKIVSQIAVLKSLKSAKILKRTAKTYVITGTINKKLKGKKVIFVFKGKVYTRKTNSKGVAKLVLKQSLFKKFKKGKIVFSAIAGEKVITNTIIVK